VDKPEHPKENAGSVGGSRPYRLRIPWLNGDTELGLGDVIMRATSCAGLKNCQGCARRATALNRWIAFSGRTTPSNRTAKDAPAPKVHF
jgi:hypothetical protein